MWHAKIFCSHGLQPRTIHKSWNFFQDLGGTSLCAVALLSQAHGCGAMIERHEECQRQIREALKMAASARGAAARQCWREIADEWASLAAEWLQIHQRVSIPQGTS